MQSKVAMAIGASKIVTSLQSDTPLGVYLDARTTRTFQYPTNCHQESALAG